MLQQAGSWILIKLLFLAVKLRIKEFTEDVFD
jgi:hypothetical protein